MKKLLDGINKWNSPKTFTIEDWNEAVKSFFGPYFRRKSLLVTQRSILRSELINLMRIYPYSGYTDLLKSLLKIYRTVIKKYPNESYSYLILLFDDIGNADANWMSAAITFAALPKEASLAEIIYQKFDIFDSILEGSYKLNFRLVYGFALKYTGNPFPINIRSMDFGRMISNFPSSLTSDFNTLLEDPEHNIKTSQWRNISAHKNFTMKSSRTFEVEYGIPIRHYKRLTRLSLERTINWSILALYTIRLCNTIIYLEYMPELQNAGLQATSIKLESMLTGLCHNLGTVGFRCVHYGDSKGKFTLYLEDNLDRPIQEAIIHASQVLDSLSLYISHSLTYRNKVKEVSIELVDSSHNTLATACVNIKTAIRFTMKEIRQKEYIRQILFNIN